jgi:hypothetical protein
MDMIDFKIRKSLFGPTVDEVTRKTQEENDLSYARFLRSLDSGTKQQRQAGAIGGPLGYVFGNKLGTRNKNKKGLISSIFGTNVNSDFITSEMENAIENTQRQKELNNLIANMDFSDPESVEKVMDIYASIGDTNMVLRLDNRLEQRKRQNTQDNFYLNMSDKDFENTLNRADAEKDFSKLQLLQPYVAEREKRKELENQKRVQSNLSPNSEESFIPANIDNPINVVDTFDVNEDNSSSTNINASNVMSESEFANFMNQSESK